MWDGLQQIDIFHILCSPRDPNCPRISNILRSQRSSTVSSCSLALFVMTELCHDTNIRGEMMKWRSTKLFRYIYFWRVMKRWEEALMEAWMEQSLWSHCFDFSWEVLQELGYCFIIHTSPHDDMKIFSYLHPHIPLIWLPVSSFVCYILEENKQLIM